MSAPVKLTGGDAQPSQEEQSHAHDGEDAGGAHSTFTHKHKQGRVRTQQQRARPSFELALKSSCSTVAMEKLGCWKEKAEGKKGHGAWFHELH